MCLLRSSFIRCRLLVARPAQLLVLTSAKASAVFSLVIFTTRRTRSLLESPLARQLDFLRRRQRVHGPRVLDTQPQVRTDNRVTIYGRRFQFVSVVVPQNLAVRRVCRVVNCQIFPRLQTFGQVPQRQRFHLHVVRSAHDLLRMPEDIQTIRKLVYLLHPLHFNDVVRIFLDIGRDTLEEYVQLLLESLLGLRRQGVIRLDLIRSCSGSSVVVSHKV